MNAGRALAKRHILTLIAVLTLVVAFSGYYFVFLTQNQNRIKERNFRVLQRINNNFFSKMESFLLLAENSRNDLLSPEVKKIVKTEIRDSTLRLLSREDEKKSKLTFPGMISSNRPLGALDADSAEQNVMMLNSEKEPPEMSTIFRNKLFILDMFSNRNLFKLDQRLFERDSAASKIFTAFSSLSLKKAGP